MSEQSELVHQTGSYRAWTLPGANAVADLVWHCRVDHVRAERHRLLPFSEPSIVVRRHFDECGRTLDCRVLITPAQLDGGTYAPLPGEEQFAIRLAPERMEAAFGMRAAEYSASESDLPSRLVPFFDTARSAGAAGDRVAALAALVQAVGVIARDLSGDKVTLAASGLRNLSGRTGVRHIADLAGISPRHLRREFSARFGMSPRAVARRLRLTSAMIEAERIQRPNWAGIAAGHGFSDQPHLIRECRVLLGESPRAIHAERLAMAVSFNN